MRLRLHFCVDFTALQSRLDRILQQAVGLHRTGQFASWELPKLLRRCYRTKDALHCRCETGTSKRHTLIAIPCDEGKIVENIGGQLTCLFPKKELPKGEYARCHPCEYRGDILRCKCDADFSEVRVPCPEGQTIETLNDKLLCRDSKKPIPQGSFIDTCDSCVYRANTLSCVCRGGSGTRSEIKMPCDAGRIIENIHGQLKCLFPKSAIPAGDYQKAFSECEQRGNVLTCKSDKEFSELELPCPRGQEPEARNKKLVCLDKKKPLPKGYYQARDARDCEYRGNVLECRVSRITSSLELPCPSDEVIDVVEGRLACASPRHLLPTGNYVQSCWGCKIDNGYMECSCEDPRQNHRKSALELPCFEAENRDGELKCKQR